MIINFTALLLVQSIIVSIWGWFSNQTCKHIEAITARANSTLGMIRRNIKKVPTSVKKQIYKTLIKPQLEYVSSEWSSWLKQDIIELEKVQWCAAQFGYNNHYGQCNSYMLSSLNWEMVEECSQKACLCVLYKAIIMVLSKSQCITVNLLHPHLPDLSMA